LVGTHILNLRENDVRSACRFQGAGERGIDFFYVDSQKKEIIIIQAEATSDLNPNSSFGASIIRKLRSALSTLNNPSTIKEGDPLIDAVQDYTEYHQHQKFSVRLIALISGRPSEGRGSMVAEANAFKNDLIRNYPNHTLKIVDSGELFIVKL